MEEAQGVEAPVEAPTQAEPSPSSDQGESQPTTESSPKSENRYQKLASENKKMREELAQLQSQAQTLDGARKLDAWLRQDPKHLRHVMDLMEGKLPPQSDPDEEKWAQLDPWVAQQLREAKEAKRMVEEFKSQQDKERQETQSRSIEQNKEHLEEVFTQKLIQDGFMSKKTDGTFSFDEAEVDLLSDAVLSRATRIAKDPYKITEQELVSAYDQIIKGTKALEKRGLKQTVKATPPLSGSAKGGVPMGKTRETEEERVMRIAKEL